MITAKARVGSRSPYNMFWKRPITKTKHVSTSIVHPSNEIPPDFGHNSTKTSTFFWWGLTLADIATHGLQSSYVYVS